MNSLFKRLLRIIAFFFLSVISFIGLYILIAFIFSIITVKAEPETSPDLSIFILTNGVHTDIVVPVKTDQKDWSKKVRFESTKKIDTTMRFVAFGWGDKEFYLETPTWADLKFKTSINAVFGLSTSAMHTTFYKNISEGKNCKKLRLSTEQYGRLIYYIESTFEKEKNGDFINIVTNANYGFYDAFYEAKGSYNLFFTCNTWTNIGLKECGQKACFWTPFATGIFYQYK